MRAHKPRVFVDADVLFAGSASPSEHSASLVVLRLAEITLIEALASEHSSYSCLILSPSSRIE